MIEPVHVSGSVSRCSAGTTPCSAESQFSMRHDVSSARVAALGGFAALMFSAATWAQSRDETDHDARARREALREFVFIDAPRAVAPTDYGPLSHAPTDASQAPDVVVMDEVRVTPLMDRDLATDIRKTRPFKATSVVKYGTGVHEKDFGKVRASALTILYVPVLVGFSW